MDGTAGTRRVDLSYVMSTTDKTDTKKKVNKNKNHDEQYRLNKRPVPVPVPSFSTTPFTPPQHRAQTASLNCPLSKPGHRLKLKIP